jgi:excisionase family DNA binding protein
MTARPSRPARMLAVADVADELATTVNQIRRLIRRGELAAVNIAGSGRPMYRVSRAALDQYLNEHAVAS